MNRTGLLLCLGFLLPLYAQAAPVLNVRTTCAAQGDGLTDDSAALAQCINLALAAAAKGARPIVYLPSGNYLVKGTKLPIMTYGIGLTGDGQHETYVTIDPSYSGTVFGWSEAWTKANFSGPTVTPANDFAGPMVHNLSVVGSTGSAAEQDAFVFYDRDDFVEFENVGVWFLNGQCLRTGELLSQTQSYMRESSFFNFICWSSGTASKPAVEISSVTTAISDATNEVRFFKLDIFNAVGIGLQVHNPTAFGATRLVDFFSPRVEQSGADNIQVSAQGDLGATNSVRMYGVQSLTPGVANNGFYALNLGLGAIQDYDIEIIGGTLGPCVAVTCNGLRIDNARMVSVKLGNIAASGVDVTYTARTGGLVTLDGGGWESGWTYSVPGTVTVPLWNTFTP
ncbi:MAG TPA: glycosyl hydrolase family 28-related protein [Chloroflexota bacterium]|jgi:hypothetical protein